MMEVKIEALEARICWCREGKGIVAPVVPTLWEESAPPSNELKYVKDVPQEEDWDWDIKSDGSYHTPLIIESGILVPIEAKEGDDLWDICLCDPHYIGKGWCLGHNIAV
jgi:hypothetical protein